MCSRNLTKTATLIAAFVLVAACGSAPKSTVTTTASRPNTSSSTSSTSTSTSTATTVPPVFPYLYVYPFSSLADAESWQRAAEPGGHQPWHFDPGFIATAFANSLGDPQIAQVINVREDNTGAHMALGFHNPNDEPVTALTVHLVRVGSGSHQPWEVVGDDESPGFTLTTPSYGSTVSSPVRVGGRITGVDENIRVRVNQSSSNRPIGERCCLAAGGVASPWSTTLAFSGATAPVLVITASTGGHLQAIDRLVFTAVRRGS